MDRTQLDEVLRRVEQSFDEKDLALVRAVFQSYVYVAALVARPGFSRGTTAMNWRER